METEDDEITDKVISFIRRSSINSFIGLYFQNLHTDTICWRLGGSEFGHIDSLEQLQLKREFTAGL